jgi:hypothetical protein
MMKNLCQVNVSLISPGELIETFHYGPYSRYWWHFLPDLNKDDKSDNETAYFPIRVSQKSKIILNEREFIVTIVVGNKDNNNFLPGYLCQCGNIVEIANDPTNAISEVYSKIFETKTRYSGIQIMGWNNEDIIKELCKDVYFIPHLILLEQIKIFVYGVGYSSRTDWFNAGPGFKSSLLYRYHGNIQALFVSKIKENSCILEIYQNQECKCIIKGESPINVWENSGLIKKFNGNQLFGIDNHIIQSLNKKQKAPTSSLQEWENYSSMKSLFNFHLKRRTIANINWHQLFVKWKKQESPLIELNNELQEIYPEDYQFSSRELGAWKTFLCAAGAHDVTPWSHEIIQVFLI